MCSTLLSPSAAPALERSPPGFSPSFIRFLALQRCKPKLPTTVSPACVPQERVKFSAIHPFSSKIHELRFVLVSQVLGYLPAVSPPSFLVFLLHVFSKRPDLPLTSLIVESHISFAVPLLPQAMASVPPLFLFSGQPPLGKYLPASYVFCL